MARKTALTKAQPKEIEEGEPTPATEDFWADPRRAEALRLILFGMPKRQVAKQIGVHRNTINNWCSDSRFSAELDQQMREHQAATRIRRLRSTNTFNDKVERVAMALITDVETTLNIDADGKPNVKPGDADKLRNTVRLFKEMAYEFRETREQERKDYGDDVKHISINQKHTLTGDIHVNHSAVNEVPFADFIKSSIDRKVIDVEAIEIEDDAPTGTLLLKAAEHILVDSDLLDRINDEDTVEHKEGWVSGETRKA